MTSRIRRRIGLLLFGLVLVLLEQPLPLAHCDRCGFDMHALCTECVNRIGAGAVS